MTEHALGPCASNRVYNPYISLPLDTILQQTLDQQKQWFLVIWSGCEVIYTSFPDAFSTNTTLRNWIGLPPRHA